MTVFFTPLVRTETGPDFNEPWRLGSLALRAISDDDLRDYLGITDRTFGPGNGELGFTRVDAGFQRLDILGFHPQMDVYRTTHAFVSELPREEHLTAVTSALQCWRLLRVSRVAAPVTLYSNGPGSNYRRPFECKLGGALLLDRRLLEESRELLSELSRIPDADLALVDMVNELGYHQLVIVLLVTLLERSLMRGDRNEIAFKVAFYGARLLRDEGYSVSDVFDDIRRAYDLRSKFVHKGEETIPDLQPFLDRLYDYATKIRVLSARKPDLVSPEAKAIYAIGG